MQDKIMFIEKSKPMVVHNSECTECGKKDIDVLVITAEENIGEHYTVDICHECLFKYEKILKKLPLTCNDNMCFCSYGHEEIAYDDRLFCPMCEKNSEIAKMKNEIIQLETILKTKYKII